MEHRLILGGAEFLPFARSRIKALKALGFPYANQSFEVDGVSIKVRIEPGHEYIRLEGSPDKYQFFTTGPAPEYVPLNGTEFDISRGYAISAKNVDEPSALGSSLESSADTPPKWPYVTPAEAITSVFPFKDVWQIQGVPEHAWFGKSSMVVSSFGSTNPLGGLNALSGAGCNTLLRETHDILYDVAPTRRNAKPAAPDSDWYRRAATTTVTHPEHGIRTFIIMVDVINTFHAYPVGTGGTVPQPSASDAAQFIKTNVPEQFVKRVADILPTWAAKAVASPRALRANNSAYNFFSRTFRADVPPYQWAFDSTGRKACAVVFERLSGGWAGTPENKLKINVDGVQRDLQEALPGLVELEFTIELTGPNKEDFTFSASVVRSLQPSVDGRFIMSADYAFPIKEKTTRDDLLLLVGRIYHTGTEREGMPYPIRPLNMKAVAEVQNLTAGTVLKTILLKHSNRMFYSASPWNVDVPQGENLKRFTTLILACDLRALAFVLQHKYTETQLFWGGPVYNEVSTTQAQRIRTYAFGKLEDEIVMEPLPSANDAKLTTWIEDTSVTGMHEWSVNQNAWYRYDGNTNPAWKNIDARKFYGGFFPNDYETLYNASATTQGFNFDYGAFLYCTSIAPLLCLDPWDVFAVHSNGSWAVAIRPVYYHAGPEGVYVKPEPMDAMGAINFDLSLMRQASVDIVSIAKKGRTSHIELFNKAYGKALTKESFHYQFSKVFESVYVGGSGLDRQINTYLKAETASGANEVFVLESRNWNIYYAVTTNQPGNFPFKAWEIDSRYPYIGRKSVKLSSEPVDTTKMFTILGSYSSLKYHPSTCAILGGSALFI